MIQMHGHSSSTIGGDHGSKWIRVHLAHAQHVTFRLKSPAGIGHHILLIMQMRAVQVYRLDFLLEWWIPLDTSLVDTSLWSSVRSASIYATGAVRGVPGLFEAPWATANMVPA